MFRDGIFFKKSDWYWFFVFSVNILLLSYYVGEFCDLYGKWLWKLIFRSLMFIVIF